MRYAQVSLQIKTYYTENKVFQHFIIVDKKMKKYVLNSRYNLHKYFEEYIERYALSNEDEDFVFINRRDEDLRVVLEFSYPDDKEIEKKGTYFFTLAGDVPYNDGCEECKHLKENGNLYCEKKEKVLTNKLKNCKFFSQKGSEN